MKFSTFYFVTMLLAMLPGSWSANEEPNALIVFTSWFQAKCPARQLPYISSRPVINLTPNSCYSYGRVEVGKIRSFQFTLPKDGSLNKCRLRIFKNRHCHGATVANLGAEFSGADPGQCYTLAKHNRGDSVMVTDCERDITPDDPGFEVGKHGSGDRDVNITPRKSGEKPRPQPPSSTPTGPQYRPAVTIAGPQGLVISGPASGLPEWEAVMSAAGRPLYASYTMSLSTDKYGQGPYIGVPIGTKTIPYGAKTHMDIPYVSTVTAIMSLPKGTPVGKKGSQVTPAAAPTTLSTVRSPSAVTTASAVTVPAETVQSIVTVETPAAVQSIVTVQSPADVAVVSAVSAPTEAVVSTVIVEAPAAVSIVTVQALAPSVVTVQAPPPVQVVTIQQAAPVQSIVTIQAPAVVTQLVQTPQPVTVTQFMPSSSIPVVTQLVPVAQEETMPAVMTTNGRTYSMSMSRGAKQTAWVGWPIERR